MQGSFGVLVLEKFPKELQRGLHMVAARRSMALRHWTIATLYAAVDVELADYPEWRYETERGEEKEIFRDARGSSGRRRKERAAQTPGISS
jgi:hypothetical protein